LQKICIEDCAMGTSRSEKKERRRLRISRPRFLPKGIVSLYEKLFSINPALFWESRGACQSTAFAGFHAHRRSEPNAPKQGGAFFQLKYTFYFQSAKMNVAKNF